MCHLIGSDAHDNRKRNFCLGKTYDVLEKDISKNFVDMLNDNTHRIIMGEDSCLSYPYLMECKNVVITNSSNYIYRQRADSIIKSVPSIEEEYQRLSIMFQCLKESLGSFSAP